jgi:hypothetical protein
LWLEYHSSEGEIPTKSRVMPKKHSSALKAFAALALLGGLSFVVFLRARQPTALGRTESPHKRYKVEIVQKRFLVERAVYLDAYRDGQLTVRRKLLYTGDFLDSDFRDLYPNYLWTSESALRIGSEVTGDEAQSTLITVVNESPSRLSYLLIEAGGNKIVLFDLDSATSVNLRFPVSGGFTSQGEFAESKKRLGVGASIPRNREAGPFEIIIREENAPPLVET